MFLAIQAELRCHVSADENVVLDGFETFSHSQYFPNNINHIIGAESEFIPKRNERSELVHSRMSAEKARVNTPRQALEYGTFHLWYRLFPVKEKRQDD